MAARAERPAGTISPLDRGDTPTLRVPRAPEDGQTLLVDLQRLKPCRYQRRAVTPEKVRQLAETIRQNGLLQNVTARPLTGEPEHDYELIAGHRRTAAFRLLLAESTTPAERERWSRIPCTLKLGLSEVQVAALAAVENMERDDGDVLDQALSLLEVKKAGGFDTNVQVAEATGMGQQRVAKLLRLAESPEVLHRAVTPGVYVEVTQRDGTTRNQHVKVDLTVALAVAPYLRQQENALGRPEAVARTERLLQRIARGNWPRTRVEAEVKRLLSRRGEELPDEPASHEHDELAVVAEPSSTERKQLFRDKGVQFVIYPKNLDSASAAERQALATHLKRLLQSLEGSGAGASDVARALP